MEQGNNKLMYENLLKQVFQVWINPELDRRKKENNIEQNFRLIRAQIIFSLGGPPEIRINDQVKAQIKVKINRSVKKGEILYERDVNEIQNIQLIDEEKDFGHITIILFKNYWVISFSFIYNSSRSTELIELGDDFLNSAKKAHESRHFRSVIELLSIAAENYAKARMYLLPDQEIRKSKTHGYLQTKVNLYSKTGNFFKSEFKDVFNKLLSIRDNARYNPKYSYESIEFEKFIKLIEDMRLEVLTWVNRTK